MDCSFCNKELPPNNTLKFSHVECSHEKLRRRDAGKCIYCGYDLAFADDACKTCHTSGRPSYSGY